MEDIIRDLVRFSRLSYERYLVGAAGGNISIKKDKRVFVTAGGRSLRDIGPGDIIEIDEQGEPVKKMSVVKPSKETALHLNIYRARKDIDSVIHVHPPYATAFAVKGLSIPMITASSRLKLTDVPLLGYADPGSKELSQLVYEGIKGLAENINAVLVKAHGIIAFARGIQNCFDIAELVEETAKIAFLSARL